MLLTNISKNTVPLMMHQCNTSLQTHYHLDDILLNNIGAAGKNFHQILWCKFYPVCLIYTNRSKEEEMLIDRPRKHVHINIYINCLRIWQLWYVCLERQMLHSNFPRVSRKIHVSHSSVPFFFLIYYYSSRSSQVL